MRGTPLPCVGVGSWNKRLKWPFENGTSLSLLASATTPSGWCWAPRESDLRSSATSALLPSLFSSLAEWQCGFAHNCQWVLAGSLTCKAWPASTQAGNQPIQKKWHVTKLAASFVYINTGMPASFWKSGTPASKLAASFIKKIGSRQASWQPASTKSRNTSNQATCPRLSSWAALRQIPGKPSCATGLLGNALGSSAHCAHRTMSKERRLGASEFHFCQCPRQRKLWACPDSTRKRPWGCLSLRHLQNQIYAAVYFLALQKNSTKGLFLRDYHTETPTGSPLPHHHFLLLKRQGKCWACCKSGQRLLQTCIGPATCLYFPLSNHSHSASTQVLPQHPHSWVNAWQPSADRLTHLRNLPLQTQVCPQGLAESGP